MGNSSWSDDAYARFSSSYSTKSTDDIFSQNEKQQVADLMSPYGLGIRESRDSMEHPLSLAIAIFLDVTGSMGRIPEIMIREKLGKLMDTLIEHDVKDAHVLFGAIGDHLADTAPLQIGQYEAGTEELVQWLTSIWIEGNGGGQKMESYLLAWLFASRHTSIDCFEKRQEKGFIFTIGDEATHEAILAKDLKKIMGYETATKVTAEELLKEASEKYHVFHIHVNEGHYKNDTTILNSWRKLLNERLLIINNYNNIAELIASTVAVMHGIALSEIVSKFNSTTADDISQALTDVEKFVQHSDDEILEL